MGIISKIRSLKNLNWSQIKENFYYLSEIDLRSHEFETIYKIKDHLLEECALELDEYKKNIVNLVVLDSEQTLRTLENNPKSFTRLGDGEIYIMEGKDQPFQKYDPLLAQKMKALLATKRDDVYVGLNQAYYQSPLNFAERNRKFYRVNATGYRRFFAEHCDKTATYLDASCFGAYFRFGDDFDYEAHYLRIKNLFKNKKVAILSGQGVFEKLEYNVFDKATDQIIVHGPRINAFSEYDDILKKIEATVPKDYLICLILGQTATALVPDLTDLGYMAWDVGHIAKDYNSYKTKELKTKENIDKFWAPD